MSSAYRERTKSRRIHGVGRDDERPGAARLGSRNGQDEQPPGPL